MLPPRVTVFVVYLVTCIWAANIIANMLPWLDYESDPLVHVALLAIVGGALGLGIRRKEPETPPPGGGDELP